MFWVGAVGPHVVKVLVKQPRSLLDVSKTSRCKRAFERPVPAHQRATPRIHILVHRPIAALTQIKNRQER